MLNIKKKVAMALTTTAIGAMLIGAGTFAIFTSSASNTGNTFAAGTLKIDLNKEGACDKYFNISNMAPGDTGSTQVIVSNTGTLDLRYDIAETLTGALSNGTNGLKITIKDHNGNVIIPGPNDNRVLTADDHRNLILSPHGQPGDEETLTVEYSLPLAADNQYQGTAATLGLTFNAEQVKNNPA